MVDAPIRAFVDTVRDKGLVGADPDCAVPQKQIAVKGDNFLSPAAFGISV